MLPNINQLLKENYLDASRPGSLSGLTSFHRALKERGIKIPIKNLKTWLSTQDSYTLHKPAKRKYTRNKVKTMGLDNIWQIDLVDMKKFKRQNKGYQYLLTCIDVFSKYAWVVPLKNKTGKTTMEAFSKILATGRSPLKIQSDQGNEFFNQLFKKLLKEKKINIYSVNSELKASVVERFNRTLKERMWRYFTYNKNYTYINVLKDIVASYNDNYHRTIKMKPKNVNKDNEYRLFNTVYNNNDNTEVTLFKFNIGDKVRISKYKHIFEKGYTPNWTEEIFIISQKIPRIPCVYKLTDLNGDTVEGIFYEEELQKIIKEDEVFNIDKILKKRTRNKQKEIFVSWLGYPKNFNSWIPASSLIK